MTETMGKALCRGAWLILLWAGGALAASPPEDDMVGRVEIYRAAYEDTFLDIARRFDLGYVELVAANPGVDPWVPGEGTEIVLPAGHLLPDAPREGLVLNLAALRLYYFRPDGTVVTHPIGIGRSGWETPLGRTRIVRKRENPTWYPTEAIRALRPELPKVVPPGPDNPLGRHALYLGWPTYLIHGTNNPWGVGRRISSGCIRLYPEDIAELFAEVPIGTPVTVVDQEIKVGWWRGRLYLEVHPNAQQVDEIEREGRFRTRGDLKGLVARIVAAAGEAESRLDWDAIRRIALERRGVPEPITPAPLKETASAD